MQQGAVISKVFTKTQQIHQSTLKNIHTLKNSQFTFALHFLELLHTKKQKCDKKDHSEQNSVFLEQQIYTSAACYYINCIGFLTIYRKKKVEAQPRPFYFPKISK